MLKTSSTFRTLVFLAWPTMSSWSKLSRFLRPIRQELSRFIYGGMESLASVNNLHFRGSMLPCPRSFPDVMASSAADLQAA